MSPQQVRALRFISKYGTTRGGHFAPNTVTSLARRGLIKYQFTAGRLDSGYHITDAGMKLLVSMNKRQERKS